MAPTATAAAVPAPTGPVPTKQVSSASRIQADPELVAYPSSWPSISTADEYYARAKEVSDLLHADASARDRGNVIPYRQIQLLKDSGLVTLLGSKSAGGAGLTWKEAYHVIRIVAQGDGSLGQLIGYHYLWFFAAAIVATDEQRTRIEDWLTKNKYFVGGAVNPRDTDLQVSQHPTDKTKLVFNGQKSFSTGSKLSDVTILEGTFVGADGKPDPAGGHVFTAVLSKQPGITYGDDWVDTLGQRGTQSGSIKIDQVEIAWDDAFGYVDGSFVGVGAFNTTNVPIVQLIFVAFYLGITQGALQRGLEYTKSTTRGWPYTPNTPAARGTDEFYIQEGYGTLQARLWASEVQFEQVVDEATKILHTSPRQNVTAEQRARWSVHISAAKVVIADLGLEVTSKVFEYQGARSIAGKYGFDLAWRDLRTHTLHDPRAHKAAEVGRFVLLGPGADGWPAPTWYT